MNRNYIIKYWIFTLLIAPLFIFIYGFLLYNNRDSLLQVVTIYLLFFMISVVVSIPTLAVCDLVLWYLIKREANPFFTKAAMIFLTILGITITFVNVEGKFSLEFILPYSITSIIVGFLLKINKKSNTDKPIMPLVS